MNIEIPTDNSTVSKIISAAIPLFATKGFKCVSVKEVAEAAGVNIALISYYFSGKENLYAFILKDQMDSLRKELEVIGQEQIDPVEKIRRFVVIIARLYKKNPYADRLFHNEILNPTKFFETIVKVEVARLNEFLHQCINDAVKSGQFRSDLDVGCATLAFINIINFDFIIRNLSADMLTEREDLMEYYLSQALEIYLGGITKKD